MASSQVASKEKTGADGQGVVGVFVPCPPAVDCPGCGGRGASDAWGFLDAVYCISLRERDDRAQQAAEELHRVGLCGRTLFFRPEKDTAMPRRGIWASHRAVAEHAAARGAKRVLVVEDDVVFSRSLGPPKIQRIRDALETLPADWMGFYLGHWPLWVYPVSRRVLRSSSLCTHAYVASERLLAWLRETPYSRRKSLPRARLGGGGIDAAMALLPAMYALLPMCAVQRSAPHDHLRSQLEGRRRRVLKLALRDFAFAHLMRVNEMLLLFLPPLVFAIQGLVAATFPTSRSRARSRRWLRPRELPPAALAPGGEDLPKDPR